MSYKSKFGNTQIKPGNWQNLSVSYDADLIKDLYPELKGDKRRRYPVLLFTPNMNDANNHHHIQLKKSEARKLMVWLAAYLKDSK